MKDTLEMMYEIHTANPQEAPGSRTSTTRAFAMLQDLPPTPRILDIGCGPGRQTIDLAHLSKGQITAIDNHIPYLKRLRQQAQLENVSKNISPLQGNMFTLPLKEGGYDLVWSEGAVYIMGFENGLRQWRRLLAPGGYIAVTELTWLQPDAPAPLMDFWEQAYPAMQDTAANLAVLEKLGYQTIGHFHLPQVDWWQDYYTPLENRLVQLRKKYHEDPHALQVLETEQQEINLYRQYACYYGYVFYIAHRGGV